VLRAGHRVDVGELDDIGLLGFEGEAERHQAADRRSIPAVARVRRLR
jgi:hypothetical protein